MSEFIVYHNGGYGGIPGRYQAARVESQGNVRLKLSKSTGHDRQIDISKVVMFFDNAEQAIALHCELNEIRQTYDEVVKAARAELEAKSAQAIETRKDAANA